MFIPTGGVAVMWIKGERHSWARHANDNPEGLIRSSNISYISCESQQLSYSPLTPLCMGAHDKLPVSLPREGLHWCPKRREGSTRCFVSKTKYSQLKYLSHFYSAYHLSILLSSCFVFLQMQVHMIDLKRAIREVGGSQ